jgi:anti-sigma factor RsiW
VNNSCDQFDRLPAERLAEHLRSCSQCREQNAADAALRQGFATPPPEIHIGFETRLRRRLQERRAPARWRPVWGWTLATYVTAATIASIVILSRLPWGTLVAPRALGLTIVALVVASPLLLLDRIGVLRPPG